MTTTTFLVRLDLEDSGAYQARLLTRAVQACGWTIHHTRTTGPTGQPPNTTCMQVWADLDPACPADHARDLLVAHGQHPTITVVASATQADVAADLAAQTDRKQRTKFHIRI
jgi:Tfp pilus assembly protein PilW